jgi:hypothetical protein
MEIKKPLIRIGTPNFVNESKLNVDDRFDLLFGGFNEFVYISSYLPWQLVNGTWTGALGYLMNDEVDTVNNIAYMTSERLNSFQFTNTIAAQSIVAIYAQNKHQTTFVDFHGIVAGVSWDVYLLTIIFWCLLVILFVCTEHVRPSANFTWFNIAMYISPCFNCQASTIFRIGWLFIRV